MAFRSASIVDLSSGGPQSYKENRIVLRFVEASIFTVPDKVAIAATRTQQRTAVTAHFPLCTWCC